MTAEIEISAEYGRTFLNFWDVSRGNDICAELVGGRLFVDDEDFEPVEISLAEFVARILEEVKKSQPADR